MRKSGIRLLLVAALVITGFGAAFLSPDAAYADEPQQSELRPDRIRVSTQYPSVSGAADRTFIFQIELLYELTDILPGYEQADTGRLQARVFDFELTGPEGWRFYVAESSWRLDTRIAAMQLRALGVPTQVVVVAHAPWWQNLEPGEYPLGLRVVSQDGVTEDSVDLKAVITAWYGLDAHTATGRLNAKTTPGDPATFDVVLTNTGSSVLDKVSVSSTRPSGIANEQWRVRFEPDSVRDLGPGDEGQISVSITPPEKAISGDYYLTLDFSGDPAISDYPPQLEMRVSVETKPVWVITGIAIVVLAFLGLMYAFLTLRQR